MKRYSGTGTPAVVFAAAQPCSLHNCQQADVGRQAEVSTFNRRRRGRRVRGVTGSGGPLIGQTCIVRHGPQCHASLSCVTE
jgi:hypothetical protein